MPDLTTYEYDIFLSHNHNDQDWTARLAERLEREDWQGRKLKVFFSPWDIRPGQSIPKEIESGLEKSRKVGLIMSPNAMGSAWVELERLVTTHIAVSARDERLIPLYLRTTEMPALLRPILPIDFRNEADFEESYQTLLAVLKNEPISRRSVIHLKDATPSAMIPRPPVVGFVARHDDQGRDLVERLKEELSPEQNQLVALWGGGGVGKTTIAAEGIRSLIRATNQRVVRTTADGRANFAFSTLLDDIAEQLGRSDLRPLATEPKEEALRPIISEKPTIIVLDNLETIAPKEEWLCKSFLAFRAQCPSLITTRERIDHAHLITIAAMTPNEAKDLLSKLIEQTHDLDIYAEVDRNRILDAAGYNPLIIQWIVGQIDLAQDPEEVLSELAQGEGEAAERVFDRSFNLPQMAQGGRAVLLALSLFMPSATRPALAEVSGLNKDRDKKKFKRAQQTLASLWLIKQTDVGQRLAVEGLTRELARRRLSLDLRSEPFRRRYVARVLNFVEKHRRPRAQELDAAEGERDNALNAMDVAFELKDWDSVMRLMRAIAFPGMLDMHGYWSDVISKGEQAMAAATFAKDSAAVAEFAVNTAVIRRNRGEYNEAKETFQHALESFREAGSDERVAACLHNLGIIAHDQGQIEEASQLYSESLDIKRLIGDQQGIALTLHQSAMLAQERGEFSEARRLYNESFEISKSLGDQRGIAASLHQLALLAHEESNLEEAERLYNEGQEIRKNLGDQDGIAKGLHQLGLLAQDEGELEKARRLYHQSLEIKKRLGNVGGIAVTLAQMGPLAEVECDNAEAARLFGEALAIFEKLKWPDAEIARESLQRVKEKSS